MIQLTRALHVQALLVDIDGTLVDSTETVEAHWRTFASLYHLDQAQLLQGVHGRRSADVIASYASQLPVPVQEAAARMEQLDAADAIGVHALPGALELLVGVPADRLALVTSGTRAQVGPRLEAAGLPRLLNIVTADDVVNGKPAADPYRAAAQLLGWRPSDCLAIEDAPAGLTSARRAGCVTVALLTTHTAADVAAATFTVPDLRAITVEATDDWLTVTISVAGGAN